MTSSTLYRFLPYLALVFGIGGLGFSAIFVRWCWPGLGSSTGRRGDDPGARRPEPGKIDGRRIADHTMRRPFVSADHSPG